MINIKDWQHLTTFQYSYSHCRLIWQHITDSFHKLELYKHKQTKQRKQIYYYYSLDSLISQLVEYTSNHYRIILNKTNMVSIDWPLLKHHVFEHVKQLVLRPVVSVPSINNKRLEKVSWNKHLSLHHKHTDLKSTNDYENYNSNEKTLAK